MRIVARRPDPAFHVEPGRRAVFALRAAGPEDSEALQAYVRALSPEARLRRFFGALLELPPTEIARATNPNGVDRFSFLLIADVDGVETVAGEARLVYSGDEAEFALSLGDAWRGRGLGAALLEALERKTAADGMREILGDALRDNETMIGFARGRGYSLGASFEPRAVRLRKKL